MKCNRCDRPARYVGSHSFAGIALCVTHWIEPFIPQGEVAR